MAAALVPGVRVHTPLGKGTVRELRNSRQVVVDVQGRWLVLDITSVRVVEDAAPARRRRYPSAEVPIATHIAARSVRAASNDGSTRVREIDLHGLIVEEALARVDAALDACMRDDVAELRVIHGRSGGRLRAALHRRLREIGSVRAFALHPTNDGVTVVSL